MNLDRNIAPPLLAPEKINIQEPEIQHLAGDIPVILINEGTQDVMKVELVFAAGNISGNIPLIPAATSELLDEGSAQHSSAEIAEALDYYGAYLQTECGNDHASVTLYTLSKFLDQTLPYLTEILMTPTFPEEEIATFKIQGQQKLAVSMEKVDYLARRYFIQALYGNDHPYGHFQEEKDYDLITTSALKNFHESFYLNGLLGIVVSGKFTTPEAQKVISELGKCGFTKSSVQVNLQGLPEGKGRKLVPKKDAVQSAIRIGRRLFNRSHPDYFTFSILNTVLGGYFGSRLMSNIREDKGYTYGIGSGIAPQISDGYFFISTEVGTSVREDAVREIYTEIRKLREELISEEELDLVKKYLYGSFQRSIDGPFSLAERHKTLLINNLNTKHLYLYLETLNKITPDELRQCAHQYLCEVDLFELIIGG
ncbi:pitrilysin family protein [soil metagenome]